MNVLLVALGGAIGAAARYLLDEFAKAQLASDFPWGIFIVNVSGSLLIGAVVGLISNEILPDWAQPLVVVGVLGGYTTFSTYSQDNLQLLMAGNPGGALLNALGQVILGIAAVYLGLLLTRGL